MIDQANCYIHFFFKSKGNNPTAESEQPNKKLRSSNDSTPTVAQQDVKTPTTTPVSAPVAAPVE